VGDDSDVTTGDAAGGVSDGVVDETGSDVSGAPVGGLDWRKQLVAGLITLAVLVVVFVGIFPKFANYGDAWASIQQMSIGSLVALGLATLLNIVVYVFPYMAALPGIRFRDAFVVRQTSFMISNAVPAGGAFGLGVQYAMLAGYRFTAAQATSAIAVTSVWNMLVTLALPALGLTVLIVDGDANRNQVVGSVVSLAALVLIVVVMVVVLRSEGWARRLGGWGDAVVHRVRPSTAPGTVADALARFREQTYDVVARRWGPLTLTNFAQQFSQFFVLLVAIYGLGGRSTGVNPAEVFAAFAIARLAGFIPVTPGGLGTVDAALVGLLSAFGMSKDEALAADLLWRAATFVPQVVIGIVTFLVWRVQAARRGSSRPQPAGAT
jgi:uncharacterized protein (TIRG00374 family)